MQDSGTRPRKFAFHGLAFVSRIALLPMARLVVDELPPRPAGPGSVIITANHRSLLDFLVALVLFRRWKVRPRALVRGDYFRHPVLGPLLRSLGSIPAGRDYGKEAMSLAREALKDGEVVGVMPEGHIPKNGDSHEIAELRPGVGVLAVESGAHLMVLGVFGTDLVWNIRHRFPRMTLLPWKRPTIRVCIDWLYVPQGADVSSTMADIRTGMTRMLKEAHQLESPRDARRRAKG
ncbi:lysophospholipid acyltransferase family protein [Actinomadura sp. KC345]|uniref:lysophospholipid acyltransferase family protein n=1 Tax=Actinomadura sp. KC345 TaxID=2530371 RepID=UPI001FB83DA2|nr:lysophospholipid acyltransferase family protein [Actinomadura sp. KC345]